MESFWIMLEPYTFLWSNDEFILLYNTVSQKSNLIENSIALNPIIKELKSKENLYSILVDKEILEDITVKEFINALRASYSGDVISSETCKNKPMVMLPIPNINEDVDRDIKEIRNREVLGRKILNDLISIDIYIGGKCTQDCTYCSNKYKQMRWCKSDTNMISPVKLSKLLEELNVLNFVSINFIGNIFSYLESYDITKELHKCNFEKKVVFDYNFSFKYQSQIVALLGQGFKINLLVGDIKNLEKLSTLSFFNEKDVEYTFSIQSEDEFFLFSNYISNFKLKNVSIYPFFNGKNKDFFIKNVYQEKEEILSVKLNKKEIFSHQKINSNFFGKLMIFPDCTIRSNTNAEPIGNIDNGLKNAIYNEIVNGLYWRKTRNSVEPCNKCLFKDLCPPISNYEIVLDRYNLCVLK